MRTFAFLLIALVLSGCDKLTGAADQKIADAEAVGFACRVAQKQPEDCMKENEAQSPSSLLDGWKSADEDIKAGRLDPAMSNKVSGHAEGEPAAEGEKKPEEATEGGKPAEGTESKDAAAKKDEKPAEEKKAAHEADAAKKPAEAAHDKPAH